MPIPPIIRRACLVIEERSSLVVVRREYRWALGLMLESEDFQSSRGRLPLRRVELPNRKVLLGRRYARGGLLRHLLPDLYLSPLKPIDEFSLHEILRERGLKVPVPVAGISQKKCCGFECEFWTEEIKGALELPESLRNLDRQKLLGSLVRALLKAHEVGFYHRDLNARNILVTPDYEVWFVDLYGSVLRGSPSLSAFEKNLTRLARSLFKLKLIPDVVSKRVLTEALLGLSESCEGFDIERVVRSSRRQLRLHRLLWSSRESRH